MISLLFVFQGCAFAIDSSELNLDFFARFNDECLKYYINTAIENNHNAKQASYKVEQYRQQVKYSLGKELPSFGVSANYLGVNVPKLDNFSLKQNAFILPFSANYEADFLLKNRDKTKSAEKSYEVEKYYEKAAYIALLTDVATVYTNILEYDGLVKLAEENLQIYSKILNSDTKKYDRGILTSESLNNSRKRVESSKNELENYQKQRDVLLMQLAVLTGISPCNASDLQRGQIDSFEYSGQIPKNIESDVIFARPDVMSAEALLEKAKIDVRIARKEFLPTFNITGLWIFNTIAPGRFFSWDSSLAALLAGASQDIFAGGRKIANLKSQKAKYEELFENYREVDLQAVKEVNSALCFIAHDSEIEANVLSQVNNDYENWQSAKKKLAQGVISLPIYLFSLSTVINSQNEAVKAKTQRLVNYYTLYKAVGGKL